MSGLHKPLQGFLSLPAFLLLATVAGAQCPALPFQLANGQTADASQVMADLSQLSTCLNSGLLIIPPIPSLNLTSPAGGTVTVQSPASSAPYNFNLPPAAGAAGQFLASSGGAGAMTWLTAPALNPPPLVDGIPVTRPPLTSFVWLNQGPAIAADHVNGPITLSVPSQSGDQVRGIQQPPPTSTPYTATAKIDDLGWGQNYYTTGLYAIDSTGKFVSLTVQETGGNPQAIQINHFNSVTSYNSTPLTLPASPSRTWWLRLNNDGTNWNFYLSFNGADWILAYSEPLTTFIGPTVQGLGVYADNNSGLGVNSLVSIWSFELAPGTGTNSSWQSTAAH